MKTIRILTLWAVILILIIVGVIVSNSYLRSTTQDNKVHVGIVLPLTGKYANIAEDIQHAVKLAQADFPNLEITVEDSAGEPHKGASAISRLITNQKSNVILAGIGSSINLAMAPIANRAQIPFLAISATPELMNTDDYTFTLQPSITREATKLSAVAIKHNAKTAGIIYDSTSDTLTIGSKVFADEYRTLGGTVLINEGYTKDIDYRTIATKVISKNPEVIYVSAQDKIAGPFVKQLRDQKYKGIIIGFSGTESAEFLRSAGKASEGFILTSIPFSCTATTYSETYCSKFRSTYNKEPLQYGAYAYDALHTISNAKNCSDDLKSCIITHSRTLDWTLTNNFSFDASGDLSESIPLFVKEVQDGKFVEVRD